MHGTVLTVQYLPSGEHQTDNSIKRFLTHYQYSTLPLKIQIFILYDGDLISKFLKNGVIVFFCKQTLHILYKYRP